MPQKIVYAHDFTPKGYLGLEKTIEYVKKWDSELIIVHVPVPEPLMTLKEFEEITLQKSHKLEKRCAKENIKYSFLIGESSVSFSEAILRIAGDTKADIVAITAKSNRLEAILGGSVTRHILHESFFPTLVIKV
jgi:nucleotide-binding universal stress UspA family protein